MTATCARCAELESQLDELIDSMTRPELVRTRSAIRGAGRPRDRAKPSAIRELRALGKSWTEIAAELGCTVAKARHRATIAGDRVLRRGRACR